MNAYVAGLAAAGVSLVQMNLFAGDTAGGERGVLSIGGREDELLASARVAAEVARRTGCRKFNALYGQLVPGVQPRRQYETALRNLEKVAEILEPVGATVLLEPLSVGENGDYPLTTSDSVLTVIACVEAGNVALLLDVYHLTNNGDDPAAVLSEHIKMVGHVQLADSPGRHEPGTGAIVWPEFFAAVESAGYQEPLALEYRPLAGTREGLGWMTRRASS
jgi:hydroxypyruvate isomerase